jgi:hypothetical protein
MPPQNMPTYEFLLGQFRARRGLYILGAGASTGDAPFGQSFMIGPAVDYVPGSRRVPRDRTGAIRIKSVDHRYRDTASGVAVLPEREFRPGTPEFPYREMLQRLPGFYARLLLKHTLSTARFSGRQGDNYRVFCFVVPDVSLKFASDMPIRANDRIALLRACLYYAPV